MLGIRFSKLAGIVVASLLIVVVAGCLGAPSTAPTTNVPNASSAAQPGKTVPPGAPTGKPGAGPQQAVTQQPSPSASAQIITVKGTGIVGVNTDAKLNFGSAGQIAKISVTEGDRVTKGTFLTKLDTTSLEVALSQAKVNLDQAKLAKTQADNSLVTAQYNLDKSKAVYDIKDAMTNDQWNIKAAQVNLGQALATGDTASAGYLNQYITSNQTDLANLTKKLNALLAKDQYASDPAGVAYFQSLVNQNYDLLIIEDARMKQLAVDIAQQTADRSQDSIDQAQKSLNLAQKQLNDATINAPFDGLIADVSVKEGDVLAAPSQTTKPIIYMIDPNTMKIDVEINELDVPKVKIGQKAVVKIDAFPGTRLEGKVSLISPTADVQGGVVNYAVTVDFSPPSTVNVRIGMQGGAEITFN